MIRTAELVVRTPQLASICCQLSSFFKSSDFYWKPYIFNWVKSPLMTLQTLLIAPAQNQDQCLCSALVLWFFIVSDPVCHQPTFKCLYHIKKPCLQSQQPSRHCSGTAQIHLNHLGFPFYTLKQIHLNHPGFPFSTLKQIALFTL